MKNKLKQLFAAARNEAAPLPSPDFAAAVLHAVRREPAPPAAEASSLFDQLNLLFPRVVLAAATIIVLCVAADFGLTSANLPELGDGAAQVSSQWLFNPGDL